MSPREIDDFPFANLEKIKVCDSQEILIDRNYARYLKFPSVNIYFDKSTSTYSIAHENKNKQKKVRGLITKYVRHSTPR